MAKKIVFMRYKSMKILNYIKYPKNYRVIDAKVSGGEQVYSPFKLYKLKKNGVTDIIDLRKDFSIKKCCEKFFCKLFNLNYENIKLSFNDSSCYSMEFYKNIAKLLDKNNKTYIHCKHGKHRTGLCLASYEKIATSHSDKKIIMHLNKFWSKKEKLKNLYDTFLKEFGIKT